MRVHHVGYVVKDVAEAIASFVLLGYRKCSEITRDEVRRVDICFMQHDGFCVELVSPWDESSVCWNVLKNGGVKPYHICYETDDYGTQSMELQSNGWVLVAPPMPAPAIENKQVAFFYHKDGGLIEIIDKGE